MKTCHFLLAGLFLSLSLTAVPTLAQTPQEKEHTHKSNARVNKSSTRTGQYMNHSSKNINHWFNGTSKKINKGANKGSKEINHTFQGKKKPDDKK